MPEILCSTYGIRMEYLWNTYGLPMEQHRHNTVATPEQCRANSLYPGHSKARGDCWVSEEASSLDPQAGAGPPSRAGQPIQSAERVQMGGQALKHALG
jgi:hypothetical protein